MKIQRILCAALVALLLPAASMAQRLASQKKGLGAVTGYQLGEIDNISLFTGAMTAALPLGVTYPVGPNLSYRFTLTYRSNGWDHKLTSCNDGPMYNRADPEETDNAGFGWSLHFGGLLAPVNTAGGDRFEYLSGDGARHAFYRTLHPGFPSTFETDVYYSNDSTYLRLRLFGVNAGECSSTGQSTRRCALVEHPNGNVSEFLDFDTGSGEDWRLTMIRDPFDNRVTISYATANTWIVGDSHGREHTLTFADAAYSRLTSATLEAFNGTTATYTFGYTTAAIDRLDYVPTICPTWSSTATVHLLTSLTLPDDAFYSMAYFTANGTVLPGGMSELRLPTGGRYAWTYGVVGFASIEPDTEYPRDRHYLTRSYGVTTRKLYLGSTEETLEGTWSYDYTGGGFKAPFDNRVPCFHRTTVTDPLGNDTVHYFSTTFNEHRWSYGLPYTYCDPTNGAYSATGPFLSSETYEGNTATGTKLRETWVEYGSDGGGGGGEQADQNKNHRLRYRKVVDLDVDGVFGGASDHPYTETTFSDFDGVGHFRRRVASGNFGTQIGRTLVVSYDEDRGTLTIDPETGTITGNFDLPASTATWLFGTYTERRLTAAGETAVTEACFEDDGFLSATRVLTAGNRSNTDVLKLYVASTSGGNGFPIREHVFGGDANPVTFNNSYTDLCGMTMPSNTNAVYRTHSTYSSGMLATSTAVDPCSGSPEDVLSLTDQTIDASTGLVVSSRDTAGVQTSFSYDARGRLITEKPAASAWTSYTFQLPTSSSPTLVPKLTIKSCPNGSATCTDSSALTWQQLEYDGLGRLKIERIRLPGTTTLDENARMLSYNARGWKSAETVWGAEADVTSGAALKTTYDQYDPFGRIGRVKPPGSNPATWFTYLGSHLKTRESKVMTVSGTQESSFTTEVYDVHGRLASVCEGRSAAWAGDCTGGVLTAYTYDVGDRLAKVCMQPSGTSCGQTRLFDYDHRGFLVSETHPEIGVLGNGATTYTYDAGGNVLTKRVAGATQFNLDYVYDKARRLTEVWDLSQGTARILKEFRYAYENDGADKRRGKLYQSVRHNWADILEPLPSFHGQEDDVIVTETFRYGGPDGRISARQTRYNVAGATFAFNLSQTYDQLGNVTSLTYPKCVTTAAGCAAAAPSRTVTYAYTKGYLRMIPGYADLISYQAGGMLHQIEHHNDVDYTITLDPDDGLERPYQISTTAGWTTGTYDYDGSGNVFRIDGLFYRYDRLGRMVSGQVSAGGTKTQSVTYDDYGNITKLVTGGSTLNTPTSTSTNRMTSSWVAYDAGGNVTDLTLGGESYEYTYDAAGMMKYLQSNKNLSRIHLYTAKDERIASFDCVLGICPGRPEKQTWTLRDLDGNVLRIYEHTIGKNWVWKEDVVRSGDMLIASVEPVTLSDEKVRHIHRDHLGSVRQVTGEGGGQVALHSYYPFGEEATAPSQDEMALRFTGHERDREALSDSGALDYMHARLCSPGTARFLSPDRVNTFPIQGQRWNRYSYTLNSPVRWVDPDGLEVNLPPEMRKAANKGIVRSAEFRRLFSKIDALKDYRITFVLIARARTGTQGHQEQKITRVKATGQIIGVSTVIRVPINMKNDAAFIGHELKHIEEIVDTGQTLGERHANKEKGIWKNATGWESADAQDAEQKIKQEMRDYQLPEIDLSSNIDLLFSGPICVEGVCGINLNQEKY